MSGEQGTQRAKSIEEGSEVEASPKILPPEAEETEMGATLWDFLMTPVGSVLANKAMDALQSLQKSTIEANAEEKKQQLTNTAEQQKQQIQFQHKTVRFGMWVQAIVFVALLIATVYLARIDKLSGTAGTVICTTLGYLFGRNSGRN